MLNAAAPSFPVPFSGSAELRRRAGRTGTRKGRPRRERVLDEETFTQVLVRECRRADRFERPFLIVYLVVSKNSWSESTWGRATRALAASLRQTDVIGWFERHAVLGLLLQEVDCCDAATVRAARSRLREALADALDSSTFATLSVTVQVHRPPSPGSQSRLSPDSLWFESSVSHRRRELRDGTKRAFDIAVSSALLLALAPLFVLIAAAVKLTSKGPAFFRQERIGWQGVPFEMLKFRSMYVDADPAIHRDYVAAFIAARESAQPKSSEAPYKIARDPRVTRVGAFLRRTSLDELPQLWNVLRGEMSLVGPRPPLQYEVERYKTWHYRRVLEATPGVTGLWQVTGRSCVTFDEMVRLDLRYARRRSIWVDLRILLATPRAVLSTKGAR